MPHPLTEAHRNFGWLQQCFGFTHQKKQESYQCTVCIEVLELIAGIIFFVGSICFLPEYAKDVDVFIVGCNLFVIGSVQYVVMMGMSLGESLVRNGCRSLESAENMGWVVGSVIFLIGTYLYFPERQTCQEGIKHLKTFNTTSHKNSTSTVQLEKIDVLELAPSSSHGACHSLAQHINKHDKEWWGTILFITGSCIYVFATFFNALRQTQCPNQDWRPQYLAAVIFFFYMVGSLLFSMGSVAFLPDVGCGPDMVRIGAWMFITGSGFFILGSLLGFWRSHLKHSNEHAAG